MKLAEVTGLQVLSAGQAWVESQYARQWVALSHGALVQSKPGPH